MNQTSSLEANMKANLDPIKGVGLLKQQEGGHGSRNPLSIV
jgi:hypothetical protein